ncbi:hypothetical protein EXIGLDRAFT_666997 [Exidia glandulosa HHB12029]|uniref:CSC1/OSCA1-like 7TM region domain-containing protein n=1 Tax=Exidia glandulosa HHB12029 TaxID=1314781 RepID=A0A165NF33_EXIGL|nr:hypothetical protein EXIGLDRAFT_666997 [Exidia glandulosa HHB12029]
MRPFEALVARQGPETLWNNDPTTTPPGDHTPSPTVSDSHSISSTSGSAGDGPGNGNGGATSTPGLSTSAVTITSGSSTFTTFTVFPAGPSATHTTSGASVTVPLTISYPSTVVTSFTVLPDSGSAVPSSIVTSFPNARVDPVTICAGGGIDTFATGVVATAILSSAVGLLLWLLFAFLRPRFRQLYGVREWFVTPALRPRPLRNSPWAFLFPHTQLVPSVPSDVSNAGRSPADDARLFPANTALSQRTIWVAFLIALGWALLGLGAALPLYMVNTPCIGQTAKRPEQTGAYSTLQDMSVVRLLLFLARGPDTSSGGSQQLVPRAEVDGPEAAANKNIETRLIVLTVLIVVPAVLPALWKLLREFSGLVAFRRRWEQIHCRGIEIAWLSASQAPGFRGWGEQRIKDYLVKNGLSQSLSRAGSAQRAARGAPRATARTEHDQERTAVNDEDDLPEVDVQGVFTVTETARLAQLIDERDIILNHLEVAETRYINSFALSTPVQSLAEPEGESAGRKYNISRPRALMPYTRRHHHKSIGSDAPLPRDYVAPAHFYKLRSMSDVNGSGQIEKDRRPPLTTSISQRLVGSRFQEMHRESIEAGQALGSAVHIDEAGDLRKGEGPTPRQRTFSLEQGPNHPDQPAPTTATTTDIDFASHSATRDVRTPTSAGISWVDTEHPRSGTAVDSTPEKQQHSRFGTWGTLVASTPTATARGGASEADDATVRRRGKEVDPSPIDRDTFPMRAMEDPDALPPPHMRLQPQQPFVRPRSGLDHEHLGAIYADIGVWRSRLKSINVDIVQAQQDGYNDIAEGNAKVKGWLLMGRGVRFIKGVRMVEGRAKDDIRWEELQRDGGLFSDLVFWITVLAIAIILCVGVTAATGLALGDAPDVATFVPFLRPLSSHNNIGSSLATTLAPAIAATLFICIALALVHRAAQRSGTPSRTIVELNAFRASFFILVVICGFWIVSVGAVIFGLQAFDTGEQKTEMVANGSVYVAGFLLVLVINAAIIAPALMLLRPLHLFRTISRERRALTPRQRYRAVYPGLYNQSFATGACILAVVFAASFGLLFPLITPPVVILLFLTLIAHRFLVGYVYPNMSGSQNGGIIQIWFLRRLATLLSLQPLLLGLLLLSHQFWVLGGVLVGWAVLIVLFVEAFAWRKLRRPGVKSLSPVTRDALQKLASSMRRRPGAQEHDEMSLVSSHRRVRTRGSMASVLEMLHVTLAVMPTQPRMRGPVPLTSDVLDDREATERAARTHPDAPPHLPALPFADHAEETHGILYPPELIAPSPIIWLPNDSNGVARSEAYDLQRYHNLAATIDVRTASDAPALPRKSTSSSTAGH